MNRNGLARALRDREIARAPRRELLEWQRLLAEVDHDIDLLEAIAGR